MYIITSFGLVYLGSYLGVFGLWVLTLPITMGYLYGVFHFEELEHNLGFYPDLSPLSSSGLRNKIIRLFSIAKTNKERQKHGIVFNTKS
jgi:hypothetical protein